MSSLRHTVIVADVAGRRWALARPRLWDRLLVRWRAPSLDAQLAAGRPAEADRRRAVRANLLVEPATRDELGAWVGNEYPGPAVRGESVAGWVGLGAAC